MAVQLELDNQDRAGLVSVVLLASIAVALNMGDSGILKYGYVKIGCLFCLAVKPEAGGHLKSIEAHFSDGGAGKDIFG